MPKGVSAPGNWPTVPGLTGPVPVPSSGWTRAAGSVTVPVDGDKPVAGEAGTMAPAARAQTTMHPAASVAGTGKATGMVKGIGCLLRADRRRIRRTVLVLPAARRFASCGGIRGRVTSCCQAPPHEYMGDRRGAGARLRDDRYRPVQRRARVLRAG